MSLHRHQLPQLGQQLFLTDGGLETTLIFHDGVELPLFAAFDLLRTAAGTARLRDYYRRYAMLAREHGLGFILESPTWRASSDWATRLGYDAAALRRSNQQAIHLMEEIRAAFATPAQPYVISGCIGPRGDGYQRGTLTAVEARDYHREQVSVFADTAADFITAVTMTSVAEAVGITLAARDCNMPVAVSFTLETDARLPTGETLAEAIDAVDALTDSYPAYYMVNCAHTSHFEQQLPQGAQLARLRGVRANASRRSHAELDEATELDAGNPGEFGGDYARLRTLLPALCVVGGCCGTDHRHMQEVCRQLAA